MFTFVIFGIFTLAYFAGFDVAINDAIIKFGKATIREAKEAKDVYNEVYR